MTLGPRLDDVLGFLRTLWALDHALHRASKRMQRRKGVTGPQRLAVRIVGRFPGVQAGELARILHVHPSTLTGILARLEARGLVRRRPHPRDGRRVVLELTPSGRRIDVDHEGTLEAAVRGALAKVPKSRVRATEEVLGRLARALERADVLEDRR